MAKVSPIELIEHHIEKVILAICALALVVVGYVWIIGTPRSLEVMVNGMAQSVGPAEVDEALARASSTVRQRVIDLQPPQTPQPEYMKRVREGQDKPLEEFPSLVDLALPGTAIADAGPGKIPPVSLTALVEAVPAPGVPKGRAQWERLRRQVGVAAEADIAAAHVAAVYPWAELQTRWQDILSRTTIQDEPAAWRVLARLQARQLGGTWGPVQSVTMVARPLLDSQGVAVEPPEIPEYDGKNIDQITRAVQAWGDESWQLFVLRPEYWPIWRAGVGWVDWRVHLPEAEVGAAIEHGTAPGRGRARPARTVKRRRPGVMDAFNEGGMDFRRPTGMVVAPSLSFQEVVVPPLSEQKEAGAILLWFHDMSLESLKEYRYQLCVEFLNPLYGYEDFAEAPDQARTKVIQSPWSEWSAPVSVPKPTEFFLTGAMPRTKMARVTVFARQLGQQVKETFYVRAGQAIGREEFLELTDPASGQTEPVSVNFATGAVAVELDFGKPIGNRRTTTEMLFLDEMGQLRTMIDVSHMDKASDAYRTYVDLEEKAKLGRQSPAGAGGPENGPEF